MADTGSVDISREFTCFLCNGFTTLLGSITLETNLVCLTAGTGQVLEQFSYGTIASVNEEEPPTTHSLIINLHTRPVYASHLLRKEKLVKYFKELGLYQEDTAFPAEALGFIGADQLKEICHPNTELLGQPPLLDDPQNNAQDSVHHGYPSAFSNLTIYSNPDPKMGDRRGKDDWVPQDSDGSIGTGTSREPSYRRYQTQEQLNQFPDDEMAMSPTQSQSQYGTPRERRRATQSSQDYAHSHVYPQAQTHARAPRELPPRRALPPPPTPSPSPSSSPPREVGRDRARHLQDLTMLFPNHSEEELKRVLAKSSYDLDTAITVIIGNDNLANAEVLFGDPNSPEILAAESDVHRQPEVTAGSTHTSNEMQSEIDTTSPAKHEEMPQASGTEVTRQLEVSTGPSHTSTEIQSKIDTTSPAKHEDMQQSWDESTLGRALANSPSSAPLLTSISNDLPQQAQPAYMTTVEDICQGIPSERLDSPVTDIQIADLAFEVKTWKELAPYIGLTEAEEEEIEVDYKDRYGLQKRQALRKWQSKLGRGPNGATYRNLIIALCRARKIKMAEKVRNLLTEPEIAATSAADHVLKIFRNYLVDCYTIAQHPAQTQWPFSQLSSYIDLTLVQAPDTQTSQSGAQPLQLAELFHMGSHQAKRKVVLIQGPAGCGKTTLSWHVCQEWAAGRLFQQFSLLIHISLQDQHVHSANCLPDTIPHESSEMRQSVAIAMSQQGGRNVCFLFDAWDEAPRDLQGRNSYLFKFISGSSIRMLPHCSIVVTSRPVAAGLCCYFTARVNIRGFGPIKLKEFIDVSLEDRTSKQKLLQALREKPQVNDLCNLPINAAIVVHLFQSFYSTLPSTRTGIFRALVCNLLLRYMQLRTDHRLDEVQELTEFEQLPYDILQHFKSVCGLAFQGIMEDRKVFLLDSLQKLGLKHPSSPLGLMQAQQQLTGFGARHCYSFLHYAVQEFLAAYHISKLSEEEQTECVGKILHSTPLSTVLPFYAGLTGLSNEGACGILLEVTKQPLDMMAVRLALQHTLHESSDRRRLLLALLNCIYEAQKPSICKVINPPQHPVYEGIYKDFGATSAGTTQLLMSSCYISFHHLGLDAIDCLSIGYFIFNKCLVSKTYITVDLGYCHIGNTEVEILMKHIRKVPLNNEGVDLFLHGNKLGHGTIAALSDALIQTSALQGIDLYNCLHPATTDIKSALKYLIKGVSGKTSLKWLGIEHCSLGPAHAYHLALLAAVSNTAILRLSENNIRIAIPLIAEAIRHNRAIKDLYLVCCDIGDRELILMGEAVQQNDKFSYLHIEGNAFTSGALSRFLDGLVGTNSGLIYLSLYHPLTDVQRRTIRLIKLFRYLQGRFLPPLQVSDLSFSDEKIFEASLSALSAPPAILSRFADRESIN